MMKGLGVGLAQGCPRVVSVLWMLLFMSHLTPYCQAFFLPALFPSLYLCNYVSLGVILTIGVVEETAKHSVLFLSSR